MILQGKECRGHTRDFKRQGGMLEGILGFEGKINSDDVMNKQKNIKFLMFLMFKTESTRKSSNINLSWTKIEYQNNLNPIALFSTLNKR